MQISKSLQLFILIIVSFFSFACSESKTPEANQNETTSSQPAQKKTGFSDPTKSMSNSELQEYDSLFNESYQSKLGSWVRHYSDSLKCEIVFHTARDGKALCINFINFPDSSTLKLDMDPVIFSISDAQFELIEAPMTYIHTRRIMSWPRASKYDLRFSGYPYQQYEFLPPVE